MKNSTYRLPLVEPLPLAGGVAGVTRTRLDKAEHHDISYNDLQVDAMLMHMQTIKVKGQAVQRIGWKRTDGQADKTVDVILNANAVGSNVSRKIDRDPLNSLQLQNTNMSQIK